MGATEAINLLVFGLIFVHPSICVCDKSVCVHRYIRKCTCHMNMIIVLNYIRCTNMKAINRWFQANYRIYLYGEATAHFTYYALYIR